MGDPMEPTKRQLNKQADRMYQVCTLLIHGSKEHKAGSNEAFQAALDLANSILYILN